jgi:hypothetical protein
VYDDTIPSSHMTSKIAAIVVNIGRSFASGVPAQSRCYLRNTRVDFDANLGPQTPPFSGEGSPCL